MDEVKAFERGGADTYLVPLAAEFAVASSSDRKKFRKLLAENIDALVAVGGADVAPALYGADVTYSVGYNQARDEMEQNYLHAFLEQERGALFGICRGQQLIAVTLGYSLFQDIREVLGVEGHEDGHHRIDILKGTLLSEYLGGRAWANVNTFHHQSVDISAYKRGPLKTSAVAEEEDEIEVIEGLESKDGRIFTVQFHPELMRGEVGRSVIEGMVEQAQSLSH